MKDSAILPTKIIAITNVAIKSPFSDPRLFAFPVSETSPPPNALPTFASPRCRRTAIMSRIALVTWVACSMNTKLMFFSMPYFTSYIMLLYYIFL